MLTRPLAAAGGRRARNRVTGRLRSAIEVVARDLVAAPVQAVLRRYHAAGAALERATRR